MINLLPEREKSELRRHYFFRLGMVALTLLSFAVAVGAVALLPSFFILRSEERNLTVAATALEESISRGEKGNVSALLIDTNAKLRTLAASSTPLQLEEVFATITRVKPVGIQLLGFAVDRPQKGIRHIELQGIAGNRESLAAFVKALEGEKQFKELSFPVSDLVGNQNLEFSLTLSGAF